MIKAEGAKKTKPCPATRIQKKHRIGFVIRGRRATTTATL